MKHIIPLTALLLTGLLLLSGCSPDNIYVETSQPDIPMEAGPAPTLLEALDLSESDVEGLDAMFEKPDLSVEKDGVTLRILETCGDGQALYLLASLTFPEGADLDQKDLQKLIQTFAFTTENAGTATGPLRYDPETRQYYFLSELDFNDLHYDGQTVCFSVESKGNQWMRELDSLVLSWVPKNQVPQVSAQNEYGTCTLTPLSINIDLEVDAAAIGAEIEEGYFISDYVEVHYQDGTVVRDIHCGNSEEDPVQVRAMRPAFETLFHLQELESVTLFDCVFAFPQG